MNKQRRKRLQEVIDKIEFAKDLLETIKEEEQGAYDNIPESLQEGDKGCTMQEKIDSMDSVLEDLENIGDSLHEVIE